MLVVGAQISWFARVGNEQLGCLGLSSDNSPPFTFNVGWVVAGEIISMSR